jgi:hypothetical protein
MHSAEDIAAGIRALPATSSAFASTQAAWRFLHNAAITLPMLVAPLQRVALSAATEQLEHYAVIVHDWSVLNYLRHHAKADRKASGTTVHGYDLYTALLLSDRSGLPIAVVRQALGCSQGTYSTDAAECYELATHQQQIDRAITHVERMDFGKKQLHIIDQGLDAVEYFRRWQQQHWEFLVRVDAKRLVKHNDQQCLLGAVVNELSHQKRFNYSRNVDFHGRSLQHYVAETEVILHRPARRRVRGQSNKREDVAGVPITLRLVVAQLRDDAEQVVAEWLLLTTLPSTVSAERVVELYYWRWKIESFFKLLKSAGHNIEQWQQQTAEAIARRLLVASMACVLVWQLARDPSAEAAHARQLLVRLSGRQMHWGKSFSDPALLAGLWTLLAMLDLLESHSLDELQAIAQRVLSGLSTPHPP